MHDTSKQWGGARPNAGRLKRNVNLSPEAAQELATVLKQRRLVNPDATEKRIVEEAIHGLWLELDKGYQQAM